MPPAQPKVDRDVQGSHPGVGWQGAGSLCRSWREVMKTSFQIKTLLCIAGVLAGAQGCTTLPEELSAPSRAELAEVLEPPEGIVVPDVDLLATTPEMREFVKQFAPNRAGELRRIDSLILALRHPGILKIEYDPSANFGAVGAFENRRANCLSFAALFIALARESGMDARFQSVEVDAQWERLNNDLLVRLQHVNTVIRGAGQKEHIVEFQRDRFNMLMTRRKVSDSHAEGLYYNNVGGQHLFDGDLASAKAYLLRAIEADSRIAAAWVNLGVVHRRADRPELAEVSYRQALHIDPENTVASNNLASLLERRGKTALAAQLRDHAIQQRARNPYYHFALAKHAYEQQKYDAALDHLDEAMRHGRKEHNFHHLLALIQHAMGDIEEAQASMRRAERKATNPQDRDQYRATLAAWSSDTQGT
ncbi:MAG: tetratricopeptide repeat protein [Pseudomonadota bacterium]